MKRHIELPSDAQDVIDQAVSHVDERLSSGTETARVVQETLVDLFGERQVYEQYRAGRELPPMTRVRLRSYNPENAFIESEHWAEQELGKIREATHHVAVGSPAAGVKVKPGWESVADDPGALTDRRSSRELDRKPDDDVAFFDEFDRNLAPSMGI